MKSVLFSVRLSPSICREGTETEEPMNYTFSLLSLPHTHTQAHTHTHTHTQAHTHRHYYCSLISNPWENAAAVCTGKLGITVNLLCTKSTRSDSESLQVRASCVALYSSPAEGKRQGCYPALYPHPLSLPLSLLHPGHRQIKPSGWSRKTIDPGGWTQTSRRVAVAESPGLHSRRTPRLDAAFSFLSCFQPHIACRGQTPDFL